MGVSEFTIADATAAGLMSKDPWKKHTRAMLYNAGHVAGRSDVLPGCIYRRGLRGRGN